MTATVTLFDPTAPGTAAAQGLGHASRAAGLVGAVVGFIDNAKPNFHLLADDLAELLASRHGVARVIRHRKTSASIPAEPEVIAALAAECDVVIAGSGD
ncbi:MAG: hypothetical protein OEW79_05640 [Betaproteobacteria bacterium]|jgi:hypothetical protein|nr:hypothetical protein [Betaproteobacteria bacterium]MDH4292918.1 hypothetical protein [Betaproteobacteria bacterium]MDH5342299.1 hypothetical protein [Betaproteobacteria bacterium]